MFVESRYKIGGYEIISIRNEHGVGMDIIPSLGGALHQLQLGKTSTSLVDPFIEGEDISKNPRCKQALLFPFPSRLEDGEYSFEGRVYNFPINEAERNNALHGFLLKKTFKVSETKLKTNDANIELIYEYKGEHNFYPFACTITLIYTVSNLSFQLAFKVKNKGEVNMPYGFGWHPYFVFNSVASLCMPVANKQLVNERLLPTGEEIAFDELSEFSIVNQSLDNCFSFTDKKEHRIALGEGGEELYHLIMDESIPYVQLYNPTPHLLAVEPVTCGINAFNTKKGLLVLAPKETNEHICTILMV